MPLREYKCTACGGRIEAIERADGTATHILEHCGCGPFVPAEEVISAPAIRFKGPGFHINDWGQPKHWTGSTDARYRMRKEIRDAFDNGELKPGENPFNSKPAPPKEQRLDDLYGRGSEKTLTDVMKTMGERSERDVNLPDNQTVKVRRKDKTHFGLSNTKDATSKVSA